QPRLMEASGGLRAPRDSVLLSCHGSGFAFDSQAVLWYQQAPEATLKWLSLIGYDSLIIQFGPSVQGRATASRDNSRSEASLSLHALHPRDSARYFCAVGTEMGNTAELEHK
ncbi:HVC33 protein, partial [Centropus unirufus]|nr:HVC33 protein [Centropus unirufus]